MSKTAAARAATSAQPRTGGSLAATRKGDAARLRLDPAPLAPKPKGKARLKRVAEPAAAPGDAAALPKKVITIPAPNLQIVAFALRGTAPYVQHRFSAKAEIMAKQAEGSTAKGKTQRAAKNFEANYQAAKHISPDGWCGIPASGFRHALISACRLVGFHMSRAKLAVFVVADGFDTDGAPIVRIIGEPEAHTAYVRNETGVVDIRARPMWREWSCDLRVQYDADQFTAQDIANLVLRAGLQVGVGEGRHDSKKSLTGMGWGTFTIEQ
jgi:hypothetical protein